MVLDDREVTCPAGSFVFIPAGMPHTFRAGKGLSRKLNFSFPAAMVGYFEELGEAVRRGDGERRWRPSQRDTTWRSSERFPRATSERG
jgi:hypothetical protein